MGSHNRMLEASGFDEEMDRIAEERRIEKREKEKRAREVLSKLSEEDRDLIHWYFDPYR